MLCPKCKASCLDQAKYCHLCGTALAEVPRGFPGGYSPEGGGPGGAGQPAGVSLPESLRRLMPGPYVEKLLAARGRIEGERRVVTILFSDVKGSTAMAEHLDPEEVLEIMNGAFEVLIEPITRYEGTLARLMGDAILAFFGAPIAHENDPERACRAALDIIAGAERFAARLERERGIPGFHVRVGMHTGLVVLAEVGADFRVEYTAMGDAVNLAARMESAAEPGTILLTEATQKLISHAFDSRALATLQVKGRSQPVSVFRLLGPKAMGASGLLCSLRRDAPPRVGREEEMRWLVSALQPLAAGKGSLVAITGEAGVGKGRLVVEARKQCPVPATWAASRGLSYAQGNSYGVARNLLRDLLGVAADAPIDDVARRLTGELDDLFGCPDPTIFPYLGDLLGIPLTDGARSVFDRLDAGAIHSYLRHAYSQYIRRKSLRNPLVLLLDDLQWSDPSSLELLESVLPLVEESSVAFVLLFRPEEGAIRDFHTRISARHGEQALTIELAPLGSRECGLLLDSLPGSEVLTADTRRGLLEKCDGNPLFLEEMLRTLLERRPAPAQTGGTNALSPDTPGEFDVPDRLQSVIMARLDGLEGESKRVLQAGAVIGKVFSRGLLAAVAVAGPDGELDLESALRELCDRRFIYQCSAAPASPNGGDGADASVSEEYAFRHGLTQDVSYRSLLLSQRRILHLHAGEALERSLPSHRLEELAGELAFHFERAGATQKVVGYLLIAAQHAKRLFAHQEAIRCYEKVIALTASSDAGRDEDIREAHEGLGDVLSLRTNYTSALEHYRAAFDRGTARSGRGALQRKMGMIYEKLGQYESALECLNAGLQDLPDTLDWAEAARIYAGLGLVYYRRGDLTNAMELCSLGLELMEQRDDPWGIAEACNNLGIICCKAGELARALDFHRRCLSIRENIGEPLGLAASHNNIGLVYQELGHRDRAMEHYRQSILLCERIENPYGLARAYDNMSQLCAHLGRQDEAVEYLNKAVSLLSGIETNEPEASSSMWVRSGAW